MYIQLGQYVTLRLQVGGWQVWDSHGHAAAAAVATALLCRQHQAHLPRAGTTLPSDAASAKQQQHQCRKCDHYMWQPIHSWKSFRPYNGRGTVLLSICQFFSFQCLFAHFFMTSFPTTNFDKQFSLTSKNLSSDFRTTHFGVSLTHIRFFFDSYSILLRSLFDSAFEKCVPIGRMR